MRSNMITVATVVTSVLLMAHAAVADPVQEQLKLMEQRMAEMEDRLQATSTELETAKNTVNQQQGLLSEAGLIEEEGLKSAGGHFGDLVDISGVVAGTFNYRLIGSDIDDDLIGGNDSFRHPNSNTFSFDQAWFSIDKAATEESRGGMHVDLVYGHLAEAQGSAGDDEILLYQAYASYLAPIGNGVEMKLGRLATPLGAEVVQANGNFNITQGAVFGLQPVTHTGVEVSTQLTDQLAVVAGVVNEVYSDTYRSTTNDKAYYNQFQFSGDNFGLNVGGIYGSDTTNGRCTGADCVTSVFDVVITLDPTENLSLWGNFDWVHSTGEDFTGHGDAFGAAFAGRLAVTDSMGVATRVEYVNQEDSLTATGDPDGDSELVTFTLTADKRLTDNLVTRIEGRWDRSLDEDLLSFTGGDDQDLLVAFWELYYEF
ncbi:MAG: outer membrane beta-barrel protein [Myxococcota bacterium]